MSFQINIDGLYMYMGKCCTVFKATTTCLSVSVIFYYTFTEH